MWGARRGVRFVWMGGWRRRRDAPPLAVKLVALVLAPVVAARALHLLQHPQPVLAGDELDVLLGGDALDGVDEQRIPAGVRGDAAAAAEHVEADADVLGADQADHVIDLLRPLVGR